MGRSDYKTMARTARIDFYGDSWLERQRNRKVQFDNGVRNELVEEVGKIWQVRLPASECDEVAAWADERQPFWDILAQAWQDTLDGSSDFHEIAEVDGSKRTAKIAALLEQYYQSVGSDDGAAAEAYDKITAVIEAHRE